MSQPSEIPMMDAVALSRAIHDRDLSCAEVMAAYLDRIDALNPRLNAIVSLRPREELMREARGRDDELAAGTSRGWMHGFPQAIKDLADAAGLPTTKGSPLLKDNIASSDASYVARMRDAGAIIIGKTNVPEFGLGSNTYNPVFGPTANAYSPAHTAGGSSGGAAVALATRLLPVADGSDFGGSLRNPGAFNNVYGLRPGFGRVPASNEDVFLPGMGVNGPMARNVADLAQLLAVQAGYDPRQPLGLEGDGTEFAAPLDRDVSGLRIGWLGDLDGRLPFEPGIIALCEAALPVFENLGCHVETVSLDYDMEDVWQAFCTLRHWQVGAGLLPLYQDRSRRDQLKPEAVWEIENGLKLGVFDITTASTRRSAWYQYVRNLFERFDFLLLPTAQVFPFAIEETWPRKVGGREMDSYHRWMEVVVPVTMSGCPAISVPVGFGEAGLPMGMQIWGPDRAERAVLEIAHAYDRATSWSEQVPPGA
ncbi:amidase [Saliniramus sp.]|uniref:amidase n=1 Tax=Saliniramus sp. TaxID=2986772 RepID=UPI002B8AA61D|nr:amidase [Saliniramus sp.]HMB12354.1 amidase [Saliniramus sp.]